MSPSGKPFRSSRFNAIKLPFELVIAVLFIASTLPVGGQNLQTLCSFDITNGEASHAALTLARDGTFYGMTEEGGNNSYGTVFRVTTNGTLTTLVSFNGTNGANPYFGLTLGTDGNLYGTTEEGGSGGNGTVFQLTTNGLLTTLVSFTNASPSGLTLGSDDNFYGTTQGGAPSGGIFFQATTNGTLTPIGPFKPEFGGIVGPQPPLALGNDGNFYGTIWHGGTNGYGSIFRLTTGGIFTTLVTFDFIDGGYPDAALTLGTNGNFYGTTTAGGSNDYGTYGTVFQVSTNGTLSTLVSFNSTNGAYSQAALTLANDGNFYGTTLYGGSSGKGTIFQVTANGTLTTLVSFSGTNGANPAAGLTQGSDGSFYGTTTAGGANDYGTVFRFSFSPYITLQPQSQTNNAGASLTFSISVASIYPTTYQWLQNGTNLINGDNISGATNSTLAVTDISDSDAGNYSVVASNTKGSVSSSNATLTVIDAPIITVLPTDLLVLAGTNLTFGVTLTGTPPFGYQWKLNNTNLPSATNAIYTIPLVATNNAGIYSVMVSNPAGSVTNSNTALTVVLSPPNQSNYAGSTATFSAPSFGPESLTYQWQKNGMNLTDGGKISGATNGTLTVASVSDADAATYTAVATNAYGIVTTSNAILTVNDKLFFAAQPQNQTVLIGDSVTITATVYGAPPFVFQWYFDRSPLGSTGTETNVAFLTLTNVALDQAGYYSVQAVNGYSSLSSSYAFLTVIAPPRLTLQLLSGYPVLNLYGALGSNYFVQYNATLADTNWLNLLSVTNLSSSPYQFLDPSGTGQSARFYRAFFAQ